MCCFLLKECITNDKNSRIAWVVEELFLKPYWCSDMMLLLFTKSIILFCSIFSNSLLKIDELDIGLKFFTSVISPDLKTGTTLEILKQSGNVLFEKHLLKRSLKTGVITFIIEIKYLLGSNLFLLKCSFYSWYESWLQLPFSFL